MDAVFLAALICGGVAAFKGNRTAWFLLASAAFTSALGLWGIGYNAFLWLLIDLAVITGIALSQKMTRCDMIIIALFVPAWVAYAVDDLTAYYVASAVVSGQLFLTFPPEYARRALKRAKETFRFRDEWTNLDPKVTAP